MIKRTKKHCVKPATLKTALDAFDITVKEYERTRDAVLGAKVFEQLFDAAELTSEYWVAAIEMCETKRHRMAFGHEIVKLLKETRGVK